MAVAKRRHRPTDIRYETWLVQWFTRYHTGLDIEFILVYSRSRSLVTFVIIISSKLAGLTSGPVTFLGGVMFRKYSTYIRVRNIEKIEIDREEMSEKSVNHWVSMRTRGVRSSGPVARAPELSLVSGLLLPAWLLLQQFRPCDCLLFPNILHDIQKPPPQT
jgi:hypothetical protein